VAVTEADQAMWGVKSLLCSKLVSKMLTLAIWLAEVGVVCGMTGVVNLP